jgi:hypothetical protein
MVMRAIYARLSRMEGSMSLICVGVTFCSLKRILILRLIILSFILLLSLSRDPLREALKMKSVSESPSWRVIILSVLDFWVLGSGKKNFPEPNAARFF